ncbi:ABC transporter substrate binding protein [Desulfobacula sp.]|uniref:ABC transporter substrate-binding protein n=1 Tax=Desulfobacula sp. TaxID=2593537 RepID=UPI0025C45863|nr:ABC transporter substrate binding protein [Desulfobacula sp.]MBC2704949.1 ABC transporter substrate-binding protein [Desulfobacula sp.]
MNKKDFRYIFFAIIFIIVCLFVFPDCAVCGEDKQIAIVVSKKIRPYMDVIEGITKGLKEKSRTIQIFFLLDSDARNNEKIFTKLEKGSFDFFSAIGPEAAEFLWNLDARHPKMFTAVLDPVGLLKTSLVKRGGSGCGISLRIPVDRQVYEISKTFVHFKKIGLLFDARNNDWFYEEASQASKKYGITIIPLKVESKKQITQVLTSNWENIDCVWMIPDQTVISEKIIQYIIKRGIYNKKGVIGYNSFFIRSGAVFAFDFDYKALGFQAAKKIETYFKIGTCKQEPPEFQTVINQKMVDKIGLRVKE